MPGYGHHQPVGFYRDPPPKKKPELPYVYFWNRMGRKGQLCRVLVRGKRNSCIVEFADGFQAVTSRNALRRKAIF